MSNYTKNVKYVTEFEGDTITMLLSRASNKHMQTLAPIIDRYMKGKGAEEDVSMSFEDMLGMLSGTSTTVASLVSNFHGLEEEDGTPIPIETVIDEIYFKDLTMEIFNKIFEISNLSKEDGTEKKLGDTSTLLPLAMVEQ